MKPAAPENIDVDLITIGHGRRHIDAEAVSRLAKSIDEIGLRTPITVLSVNEGERLDLVAGAHRLAAVKSLAWPTIPCLVIEGDALDAEMWEITENLLRVDLSKEQRDQQIRRYAELLEEKETRVAVQNEPKLSKRNRTNEGRPKGIAKKVSEQTGLSKSTVRRALFHPDPEKVEQEKAKKAHDKTIKADLSEDAAELLFDNFGLQGVPHLLSLLDGASLKEIIAGLRRRLHDAPVFDRSAA
ncbi:ParB N-terminal domain-containing protein [Mesorhizobium sp. CA8]|uniref:ParB N-terminal domain-containing protein n=1 Tax=Mesorhizobium sp. CA8 TaxID=2876637 RepID=UPI001CCA8A77|nr:ParB N-terminal domain-containing protein [Mesorhizobium sp. CA8]MBZ9759460.1 ParB N-terminal domain-containing protein [Mesorhizobium sp. CA8]